MIKLYTVEFKSKIGRKELSFGTGTVLEKKESDGSISYYGLDGGYKYTSKLEIITGTGSYTTTDILVEHYKGSTNSIIGNVDKFKIVDVNGGRGGSVFNWNGVVENHPEIKIEIRGTLVFEI